jgi:DNA sulfur modification protein DndD
MLIKKIKARNFKTYLNLDLDITVEQDRPIILIGGANGGGKTTFFEAIYGALYGLKIQSAKHFHELLNAGALGKEEEKITLELHFSGRVLNEEQQYALTRTYILNPSGMPVESVRLNMNGNIFLYGTATAPAQRAEQEAQVNKIIKANLPQELSRYFLFDAMEAGNLLKEDQLNRVIRENIENVMGFNKYLDMARASENLFQAYTAQRLQQENEKKEYLDLVEGKKEIEGLISTLRDQHKDALQYSVANKDLYDSLKAGLNQESTIKNKIEQLKTQIENTRKREEIFKEETDLFVRDIELNVFLPRLFESIKSDIQLILEEREQLDQKNQGKLEPEQIDAICRLVFKYLKENKIHLGSLTIEQVVDFVIVSMIKPNTENQYDFLEFSETKALEKLLQQNFTNTYPALSHQKTELNSALQQIETLENQIERLKGEISGRDYSLIRDYEVNEKEIAEIDLRITMQKGELGKIEKRIHQYDIQTSQEPDPKYETLAKLKPFFEEVADFLLRTKKEQIELRMKDDLNINLAAYQDVIDRVELSENLRDLTFKIFHKSGNEIYLGQLNTASKQMVVQVLLKALHEYGDYDPPVMIDTVMGVLDENSRATVLENYFPELSHQTILLSSDSEIRPDKDLVKIEPFISKTFTLVRDKQAQKTEVSDGYFGNFPNV